MKGLIIFLVAILIICGIKPFFRAIGVLADTLVASFPLFWIAFKEYMSTPYAIVGTIMIISSLFGFYIGKQQGRELYIIISVISAIISILTLGIPLFS